MRRFLALLVAVCSMTMYAETFHVATAEWRPYAYVDEDKVSGISVEIMQEIARHTGDHFEMEIVPAKRVRILFEKGKIAANFADSPSWNPPSRDSMDIYSKSYFSVKEYLYFQAKNPLHVKTSDDLYQKVVGITSGYYYEMLEDAFSRGDIIKDEAPGNIQLIKKLSYGRNEAIIMDNLLFDYLIHTLDFEQKDFKRGLRLSNVPLSIRFRIEEKKALLRINKAITQLRKKGSIKAIVKKYREKKNW